MKSVDASQRSQGLARAPGRLHPVRLALATLHLHEQQLRHARQHRHPASAVSLRFLSPPAAGTPPTSPRPGLARAEGVATPPAWG